MKATFVVDMQYDFIYPKGRLYVKGAEEIVEKIKSFIAISEYRGHILLGSVDRHFEDDLEMKQFPPHCMNKTEGQKLITEMFLNNHYPEIAFVPNKVGEFGKYEQTPHGDLIDIAKTLAKDGIIIFEKQTTDVFTNPCLDFMLEKLDIDEVYVVGVATDYCVKEAVLGFLKRGIKTTVVIDAIKGIDKTGEALALDEMVRKGAKLNLSKIIFDD